MSLSTVNSADFYLHLLRFAGDTVPDLDADQQIEARRHCARQTSNHRSIGTLKLASYQVMLALPETLKVTTWPPSTLARLSTEPTVVMPTHT